MMKRIEAAIVMRPALVAIIALIGIATSGLAIWRWDVTTDRVKVLVETKTRSSHSALASQVRHTSNLIRHLNSPASNLARLMNNSLNATTDFSQSGIQTKVAPLLFQQFATLPYISQIAYLALDGSIFSYCREGNNQVYAMYSRQGLFYKQPVDPVTGNPNRKAKKFSFPTGVFRRRVREALSSNNKPLAFVSERSTGNARKLGFFTLAGVNQNGAVLLEITAVTLEHFFATIDLQGGLMQMATRDGNQVVFDQMPEGRISKIGRDSVSVRNVTCLLGNSTTLAAPSMVEIEQREYRVYCSSTEVLGIGLVYALAFPNRDQDGSGLVRKSVTVDVILLAMLIVVIVIAMFGFLRLIITTGKRDIQLSRALIKQKEATEQAERKSMTKTRAYNTASHEIRNLLTPISGFVQDRVVDLPSDSATAANLMDVRNSIKELVGYVSSILDASKLEEGMMELEEQEFDVFGLLEEVVNLFYGGAMKKDVDLVLDLSEVSILRFGHRVIGDRGKLKQILCNLVSNAVKYTDRGQIVVRSLARKPSLESGNVVASSDPDRFCSKWVSKLVKWNGNAETGDGEMEEEIVAVNSNHNRMEFVFEVDDSGKGVPRDMQKSIFENYVQVRQNSDGQVGTGLGLGIVQSLVRLMGGEIGIMDKEKEGTCFRFNILLTLPYIQTGNLSPRPFSSSPRSDGSKVILLIGNEARRRASKKLMKNLGVSVSVVDEWEDLEPKLNNIKSKFSQSSPFSSSSAGSRNSSARSKDIPLSALDGMDQKPTRSPRAGPGFVLVVIDSNAGPFGKLLEIVSDFKRDLHNTCFKVVWIDGPNRTRLEEGAIDPSDEIKLRPFHGSCLMEVVELLPQFDSGGRIANSSRSLPTGSPQFDSGGRIANSSRSLPTGSPRFGGHSEIQEEEEKKKDSKPLDRIKCLVVEDNKMNRKVTTAILSKLGATFEQCEDGLQALELFRAGLQQQASSGVSHPVPPFGFILMDCEMPKMDGYEATRVIREEERKYGIHTPIVGVTGHTSKEKLDETIKAGMDDYLSKPVQMKDLIAAIDGLARR